FAGGDVQGDIIERHGIAVTLAERLDAQVDAMSVAGHGGIIANGRGGRRGGACTVDRGGVGGQQHVGALRRAMGGPGGECVEAVALTLSATGAPAPGRRRGGPPARTSTATSPAPSPPAATTPRTPPCCRTRCRGSRYAAAGCWSGRGCGPRPPTPRRTRPSPARRTAARRTAGPT